MRKETNFCFIDSSIIYVYAILWWSSLKLRYLESVYGTLRTGMCMFFKKQKLVSVRNFFEIVFFAEHIEFKICGER